MSRKLSKIPVKCDSDWQPKGFIALPIKTVKTFFMEAPILLYDMFIFLIFLVFDAIVAIEVHHV